ncbi:MAG: HDOD domain-containing protein [Epsilonproteobacteria bacterium]|nr:hypothetical protein [Campylobacterota bacterium]NPA57022.1 HDOD domain-containing protein [Campylobacterota bacterium]
MATIVKHPILDREGNIWAYELRDRDGDGTKALLYLLAYDLEFKERLEEDRIYLPVDRETLLDESVTILDPKYIWIAIKSEVDPRDPEILQQIWNLKEKGYKLALEGVGPWVDSSLLPLFDLLEIDREQELDEKWIGELKSSGFLLLARGVEEAETFIELKKAGFDYFQGYFFARPIETKTREIDGAKLRIMEIYGMLEGGGDLDKIVEAFKQDPQLTIALLRYINSPYFGLQKEVSSVRFAINFIGPQRLKRWLTLMLYASEGGDHRTNPLYQLAKSRANLMAHIAKLAGLDEEKAYLTGVLSLVEILLGVPMQHFIKSIRIDQEVASALLDRTSNGYGKLLTLIIAHELGNRVALERYLEELGIDGNTFAKAVLEAL